MSTSAPTTRILVNTSTASAVPPPPKKPKQQRYLNVAVAGCSHGEMDRIYSNLQSMEQSRRIKFDLLICCGDYQAIRNLADLQTMHVHPKYLHLGTFHQYYSGQKVAPIFTIFVGGNHESSSFLAELPNGGWVAPNIYYMGFSNVVKFAGLTIGGLSGIYKGNDYHKGHFERPPFNESSKISAYHVRSTDIFRLKQLARREGEERPNCLDIMVTHDWPIGITDYGDTAALLRYKPFFKNDIENGVLGNPETMELLRLLKPRYWFSAHLHCRYEAQVDHEQPADINMQPEETKFLALGKPAPRQRYVEGIQIPISDDAELIFEYDPLWCTVLRNTDHLLQITNRNIYMPSATGREEWDFRPTKEQIEIVKQLFENNSEIPNNFRLTAPPHKLTDSPLEPCLYYQNPQSTEFCDRLQITNFNELLYQKTKECQGIPFYRRQNNAGGGAEEIDLGDLDDDEDGGAAGGGDEFGDNFFVVDGDDDDDQGAAGGGGANDEFGDNFFVVDGDDVEEPPCECDAEEEKTVAATNTTTAAQVGQNSTTTVIAEEVVQVSTTTTTTTVAQNGNTQIVVEEETTTTETYIPPPLTSRVTVADRILKRRHVEIPEEED